MKLSKRQFFLSVSNIIIRIIVNVKAWSPAILRWRPLPLPTFSNEGYYRDFSIDYRTPFEQDLQPPYLYESDVGGEYEWRVRETEPGFDYNPRREFRGYFDDEKEDLTQFWEEKEWDLEEERLSFNVYYDQKIRNIMEQKRNLKIEMPSLFVNSFEGMCPDEILRLPNMRSEILGRDIEWDIPTILDEASIYLEDDPLCAELLGLPIRLDSPFSESSETSSVNDQRGVKILGLQLRVEGSRNSGTVELMATETGIYDIFLRVDDESRVSERMSRALFPLPRRSKSISNPKILDAEIIDRE